MIRHLGVFAVGLVVLTVATNLARRIWPLGVADPMAQATAFAVALIAAWPYFRQHDVHHFSFFDHVVVSVAISFAFAAFRMAFLRQ